MYTGTQADYYLQNIQSAENGKGGLRRGLVLAISCRLTSWLMWCLGVAADHGEGNRGAQGPGRLHLLARPGTQPVRLGGKDLVNSGCDLTLRGGFGLSLSIVVWLIRVSGCVFGNPGLAAERGEGGAAADAARVRCTGGERAGPTHHRI